LFIRYELLFINSPLSVHNLLGFTRHQEEIPPMKTSLPPASVKPFPLGLSGLIAFESVARHLSFARAAGELQVTPTAVSKTVKQIEVQLGVRLFNRTTRSVGLTESGRLLLEKLKPALDQIRASLEEVQETTDRPYGVLKINSSYVAYAALIEPHLPAFLKHYPGITLEFAMDNQLSDIVSDGFDAGVRLGHSLQQDMVALPIGPAQQKIVVGSPHYLQTIKVPRNPEALLAHDCIRQRIGGYSRFMEWSFLEGEKATVIDVSGRLVFDEMRTVVSAAIAGCGLAYVYRPFVARELEKGELAVALEHYSPTAERFHLYYPSRAQVPGKLRAFIDFMHNAWA
jgi:DNA-binding transcriptional LysR family regulator